MSERTIPPAPGLRGEARLPGDKSISHRAVLLGSIARGTTRVRRFLESEDCLRTLEAMRALGVEIRREGGGGLAIEGRGPEGLREPAGDLDLGNSGTSMRLLAGVLAGRPFRSVLTGDASLSRRPMGRILEPLGRMGAGIRARGEGGRPPLEILGGGRGGRGGAGGLAPIRYETPVASAQVKSAVLLAGLEARGTTTVVEPARSRDHTERMLREMGAAVEVEGLAVSVRGPAALRACEIEVPGDVSSAAFPVVAACLIEGSHIRIRDALHNPTRCGFLRLLERMGAEVRVENLRRRGAEETADLEARAAPLRGITVEPGEIPAVIDELPILMVAASLAAGRTEIHGAGELRVKETDRIRSMTGNLRRMGARIEARGDEIRIEGVPSLRPAALESHGDHRTAMAMAVAAMAARGEGVRGGASVLRDTACIDTSFPGFFETMAALGACSSPGD